MTVSAWAEEIKDSSCLECHSDKELTKTNAANQSISLFVDEAVLRSSKHRTNSCASCHRDIGSGHPDDNVAPKKVDCALCHASQSSSYGDSGHGVALRAGDTSAATCADCHGSHHVLAPASPDSPLHRSNLSKTCGECHPDVARELEDSVHGRAVAKGLAEPPTCIDCHTEHGADDLRRASTLKIAEQVCSRCHASERLNTKYKLPADRVRTFWGSYHGLAVQFGSTRTANCASCHGYHHILPSSDPRSTTHSTNLVATCGKCHPGASENFVAGKIHSDNGNGSDVGGVVNRWVRRLYLCLIFGTVGFMAAHNLLLWRRKILAHLHAGDRSVVRMDRSQRLQHLVLLGSFFFLALTGFALEYPHSWLAWLFGSDELIRRWCHRVAGIVLLLAGAYHLYYLAAVQEGRRLLRDMIPRPQDWRDFLTMVRHLLKRGSPRPRFGRFGYAEKVEYWAVLWGTVIMGVTGLAIWFKVDVTRWLPRWIIDVASTVHFYEAILAILAIAVWHIYHVMFDPDVYPGNFAWWDGKVKSEWHRHEHPLDTSVRGSNRPSDASSGRPERSDRFDDDRRSQRPRRRWQPRRRPRRQGPEQT